MFRINSSRSADSKGVICYGIGLLRAKLTDGQKQKRGNQVAALTLRSFLRNELYYKTP